MSTVSSQPSTPIVPSNQVSPQLTQENERWFRLVLLVDKGIQPALLEVLHDQNNASYTGLPRSTKDLYRELNTTHNHIINNLKRQKKLNQEQYDLLLPSSGETVSERFDMTLLVLLIRSVLDIPISSKKWIQQELQNTDTSIQANVIRARDFRNFLMHVKPDMVDAVLFNEKWTEGERIVKELNHPCNFLEILLVPLENTSVMTLGKFLVMEKKFVRQRLSFKKRLENLEEKFDKRLSSIEKNSEEDDSVFNTEHIVGNTMIQWKPSNTVGINFAFEFDGNVEEIHQVNLIKQDEIIEIFEYEGVIREGYCIIQIKDLVPKIEYEGRVIIRNFESFTERILKGVKFLASDVHRELRLLANNLEIDVCVHDSDSIDLVNLSTFLPSRKGVNLVKGTGECVDYVSYPDWLDAVMKVYITDSHSKVEDQFDDERWKIEKEELFYQWYETNDFTVLPRVESNLIDTVGNWSRKKNMPKTFLFPTYNLREHLNSHGYGDRELEIKLNVPLRHSTFDYTLLFVPDYSIILLMRTCKLKDKGKPLFVRVQRWSSYLKEKVKMFSLLIQYLNEAKYTKDKNSGDDRIVIVPVLLFPDLTQNQLHELSKETRFFCEKCKILTGTDIDDPDLFEKWWNENVQDKLNGQCTKKCSKISKTLVEDLIAFSSYKDLPCTPCVGDSHSERINKICLTEYQFKILYTPHNHALITGAFGSGKSLMIICKLYQLAHSSNQNTTIYYLNHDSVSTYINFMKKVTDSISSRSSARIQTMTFSELAAKYGIPNITLDVFLEIIQNNSLKKGHPKEHLFIEEFDGAHLDEERALKISCILKERKMRDRIVWIAVKSIMKKRLYHEAESEIIRDEYKFAATGMEQFEIPGSVRSTTKINKLIRIARKVIMENPTQFVHQNQCDEEEFILIDQDSVFGSSKSEEFIEENENVKEDYETYEEVDALESTEPEDKSDRIDINIKNVDYAFKYSQSNDNEIESDNGNYPCITTNVEFFGNAEDMHHIEGEEPVVIYPFKDNKDSRTNDDIFRLYVALRYIVTEGTVIICTDDLELGLCYKALLLMKERDTKSFCCYTPSMPGITNHQNNIHSPECILLTDNMGVNGREFSRVVITMTPSEVFLSHTLISAIARSQNHVSFIVFHSNGETCNGTTQKIIEKWKWYDCVKELYVINSNNKELIIQDENGHDIHETSEAIGKLRLDSDEISLPNSLMESAWRTRPIKENDLSELFRPREKSMDRCPALLPAHDKKECVIPNTLQLKETSINVKQKCVDVSRLNLKEEIGSGYFTVVWGGVYTTEEDEKRDVAVKMLKEGDKNNQDFLEHACSMANLDHQHILRFIALIQTPSLMMVTELAPLRTLGEYLKNTHVTTKKNLSILSQVNKGMEYLESKRVVHRSLSASNILVISEKLVNVKISLSVLSRALSDNKNYYISERYRFAPVRWYAPECINRRRFSSKGDVWSFGVTVWEALTYAKKKPYHDLRATQIVRYLEEGNRLIKPDNCSDELYGLMNQCWEYKPEDRPTFIEIGTELDRIYHRYSKLRRSVTLP